ncbi:MAG: WYL domain-containing protein [Chloroflexi bacterium]|nr:WYL domain-containing protein [Chloroflexota bacterium]
MSDPLAALLAAGIDQVPITFLDVETTGLYPELGDRVVEIAALRCEGDLVVDALHQLINPQRRIGAGAFAVHGITDDMVRDAPHFAQIAGDVLDLLRGAVFVGHNAPFDLGFLLEELSLVGMTLPPMVALCTLRLSRRQYRLPGYSLGRVTETLGLGIAGETHRAMTDVLLTRALMTRLIDDMWARGIRTVRDYVAEQGGPISVIRSSRLDVPIEIREALADDRLLALRYRAMDGTETQRFVRPYRVVRRSGQLLLLGYCLLRNAERTFRIDRIIEIEIVDRFE